MWVLGLFELHCLSSFAKHPTSSNRKKAEALPVFFQENNVKPYCRTFRHVVPRDLELGQRFRSFTTTWRISMRRISAMRSQTFSNRFVKGPIAALICRATASDVMGTLVLSEALLLSSNSLPSKLLVFSPVILKFISPASGALISNQKVLY